MEFMCCFSCICCKYLFERVNLPLTCILHKNVCMAMVLSCLKYIVKGISCVHSWSSDQNTHTTALSCTHTCTLTHTYINWGGNYSSLISHDLISMETSIKPKQSIPYIQWCIQCINTGSPSHSLPLLPLSICAY